MHKKKMEIHSVLLDVDPELHKELFQHDNQSVDCVDIASKWVAKYQQEGIPVEACYVSIHDEMAEVEFSTPIKVEHVERVYSDLDEHVRERIFEVLDNSSAFENECGNSTSDSEPEGDSYIEMFTIHNECGHKDCLMSLGISFLALFEDEGIEIEHLNLSFSEQAVVFVFKDLWQTSHIESITDPFIEKLSNNINISGFELN